MPEREEAEEVPDCPCQAVRDQLMDVAGECLRGRYCRLQATLGRCKIGLDLEKVDP